jgi:hypothetical protein
MRGDRAWAFLAFLLAVTALLLPWWRVTLDDGAIAYRFDFRAFQPAEPWTTSWAPWLTGVLAAAAALVLFVRLAANSHEHEPASWRRDLVVSAALLGGAVASCLLWPDAVPSFWGGRTYHLANTTGPSTTETASPGLGWWLAVVATGLAALAAGASRRQEPGDPSTATVATDK